MDKSFISELLTLTLTLWPNSVYSDSNLDFIEGVMILHKIDLNELIPSKHLDHPI